MAEGFLQRLKIRAKQLKQQLVVVYYAAKDPRVGLLAKFIIGLTILYALSPIDLIPDFIPVLGYLDDLIIVPLLLAWALRLIPKDVLEECRQRAQEQPIRLSKNWTFAILFILVWVAVALFLVNGAWTLLGQ